MYFPDRRAYEADVRDFLRAADDFRSSFQQQHQRQQHAPAPPSRSRRQLPPAPASIPQYPYDDDVTHPKTFYEPQQHSRDAYRTRSPDPMLRHLQHQHQQLQQQQQQQQPSQYFNQSQPMPISPIRAHPPHNQELIQQPLPSHFPPQSHPHLTNDVMPPHSQPFPLAADGLYYLILFTFSSQEVMLTFLFFC